MNHDTEREGIKQGFLFMPCAETVLRGVITEALALAKWCPEILEAIERDQEEACKRKKRWREDDRRFLMEQTPALGWYEEPEGSAEEEIGLGVGCPRMEAIVVHVFMTFRGYWGSVSTRKAIDLIRESRTIFGWLMERGIDKTPGATTILENINMVKNETREMILDAECESILNEGLDDFMKSTVDSTAVAGNTAWPTDGVILHKLLSRSYRISQKLKLFGVKNLKRHWMPRWLKRTKRKVFEINVTARNGKTKKKLKKRYRSLLRTAGRAAEYLSKAMVEHEEEMAKGKELLPPGRRARLERLWKIMGEDVADARKVIEYAEARVFRGAKISSREKVLSVSDRSAAFIKKGSWESVIGYRPQLVRSGNGFVTCMILPEGNASDAPLFAPAIEEDLRRTGVMSRVISADDGYGSREGRDRLLKMGADVVSIKGGKGRRLTPDDEWESEMYAQARNDRSTVEGLISILKLVFEFGHARRRGREAVRAEMLEKVIAYNFYRMCEVREKRRAKAAQDAAKAAA